MASFLCRTQIGVCIIGTIPHCHAEMLSKGAKSRNVASFVYSGKMEYVSSIVFHTVILNKLQEMWFRHYIEDKVGVCIIDSIPHCFSKHFNMAVLNSINYKYSNFVLYIVTKPHFLFFASFQSIFIRAVWNTINDRYSNICIM